MSLLYIPFFLQGGAMFADEFYFHRKRGLHRWERIGHPLDTITVLLCYLYLLFSPVTQENIYIYGGLAIFSWLFVTKDEFVHARSALLQNTGYMLFFLFFILLFSASRAGCGSVNPLSHF